MSPILITGFKPFQGEKINPTEKILEQIQDLPNVDTLLLPVSFKKAPEDLLNLLSQELDVRSWPHIMMLGQAGGRTKISLERVALNWVETDHRDEFGYQPKTGLIDPTAPEAIFNAWPLADMHRKLIDEQIPAEISFSAGGFVCNYLYFKLAAEMALAKRSCLFVHVPYLPEQVTDKPQTPSMPLDVMVRAVRGLIECLK